MSLPVKVFELQVKRGRTLVPTWYGFGRQDKEFGNALKTLVSLVFQIYVKFVLDLSRNFQEVTLPSSVTKLWSEMLA